jgi:hypothetical protein
MRKKGRERKYNARRDLDYNNKLEKRSKLKIIKRTKKILNK